MLFGVLLGLVVLEVGMRIAGFTLMSLQEYRNVLSLRQKGTYRILCVGESTTADIEGVISYPRQLETILNERAIGMRFSVINKGMAGMGTKQIISDLEANLNKYNPDMIITMMGINDADDYFVHLDMLATSKMARIVKSLKIYKLGKYLQRQFIHQHKNSSFILHGEKKARNQIVSGESMVESVSPHIQSRYSPLDKEEDVKNNFELDLHANQTSLANDSSRGAKDDFVLSEETSSRNMAIPLHDESAYIQRGLYYKKRGLYLKAERMFAKAVEANPHGSWAYVELGQCYAEQKKYTAAINIFKRLLAVSPNNALAHTWLEVCKGDIDVQEQREALEKDIELKRDHVSQCVRLGALYDIVGMYEKRDAILKKAIELNQKDTFALCQIAWMYDFRGAYEKAHEVYLKAIEFNQEDPLGYAELTWHYYRRGKLDEAEFIAKKAIEKFSNYSESKISSQIYGLLAQVYTAQKKKELAQQYFIKAKNVQFQAYALSTIRNYQSLRQMVRSRGVQLVCVQYPMRAIEPLKEILALDESIVFVDNETVFKNAIENTSYKEYFYDMFAGDFGHCNNRGNKLLAENVARVILKEVFKQ